MNRELHSESAISPLHCETALENARTALSRNKCEFHTESAVGVSISHEIAPESGEFHNCIRRD